MPGVAGSGDSLHGNGGALGGGPIPVHHPLPQQQQTPVMMSLLPRLIEPPRGRSGQRVFYRGFRYVNKDVLEERMLEVGEFAFVRITPNEDPCIAEMQLCWRDELAEVSLASLRLYFLPEQTDNGRQSSHGQHELLVASDTIVLRLDDLVGWITEEVEWNHGLVVPGVGITNLGSLGADGSDTMAVEEKDKKTSDNGNSGAPQRGGGAAVRRSIEDNKENNLLGANSPPRDTNPPAATDNGSPGNGALPLVRDGELSCPHVVVLSYPRYCRFRAILRRLEGHLEQWRSHPLVEALGGVDLPKKGDYHIHFAREEFEHETLSQNEQVCDHLGPSLKSRYKRKSGGIFGRRARSPGSDSNASEEGRDNIRIQIENRMAKNNTSEACKRQEDFLKKLFNFMRERKTPISRIPNLGFKQIDLFDFFTLSQEMGGYESITCRKLWKKLHDTLGGSANSTSAATYTRRHYERLLLPYERHVREIDEEKRRKKKAAQEEKANEKAAEKAAAVAAAEKQLNGQQLQQQLNDKGQPPPQQQQQQASSEHALEHQDQDLHEQHLSRGFKLDHEQHDQQDADDEEDDDQPPVQKQKRKQQQPQSLESMDRDRESETAEGLDQEKDHERQASSPAASPGQHLTPLQLSQLQEQLELHQKHQQMQQQIHEQLQQIAAVQQAARAAQAAAAAAAAAAVAEAEMTKDVKEIQKAQEGKVNLERKGSIDEKKTDLGEATKDAAAAVDETKPGTHEKTTLEGLLRKRMAELAQEELKQKQQQQEQGQQEQLDPVGEPIKEEHNGELKDVKEKKVDIEGLKVENAAAACVKEEVKDEPAAKRFKQEQQAPSPHAQSAPHPRPNPAISSSPRLPPSPHTASPPTQVLPQGSASTQRQGARTPLPRAQTPSSGQAHVQAQAQAQAAQQAHIQRRLEEELAIAWRTQIAQLCGLAAANNPKAQQELMARLMEQIYTNGPYAAAAGTMLQALTGRPTQLPSAMAQLQELGKAQAQAQPATPRTSSKSKPEPAASPKLSFQPHRMSPSLPTPANGLSTPPPKKDSARMTSTLGTSLSRPSSRTTPLTAAHASSLGSRATTSTMSNDALDLSIKKAPARQERTKSPPKPLPAAPPSSNGLLDLTVKKTSTTASPSMSPATGHLPHSVSSFLGSITQQHGLGHSQLSSPLQSPSQSSSGQSRSSHKTPSPSPRLTSPSLNPGQISPLASLTGHGGNGATGASGKSSKSSSSPFNPLNPMASMASLLQSAAAQAQSSSSSAAAAVAAAAAAAAASTSSSSSSTGSSSKSKNNASSSSSLSVQSVPIPPSSKHGSMGQAVGGSSANGKLPKVPHLIPFHDMQVKSTTKSSSSSSSKSKSSGGGGSSASSSASASAAAAAQASALAAAAAAGVPTVSDYNPTLPTFIPQNLYPGLGNLGALGGLAALGPMNPMMAAAMMRQNALAAQAQAQAVQAQAAQAQAAQVQAAQQAAQQAQAARQTSSELVYKEIIERTMMLPPGMGGPNQLQAGGAANLMQQYLQMMYGGLPPPK